MARIRVIAEPERHSAQEHVKALIGLPMEGYLSEGIGFVVPLPAVVTALEAAGKHLAARWWRNVYPGNGRYRRNVVVFEFEVCQLEGEPDPEPLPAA